MENDDWNAIAESQYQRIEALMKVIDDKDLILRERYSEIVQYKKTIDQLEMKIADQESTEKMLAKGIKRIRKEADKRIAFHKKLDHKILSLQRDKEELIHKCNGFVEWGNSLSKEANEWHSKYLELQESRKAEYSKLVDVNHKLIKTINDQKKTIREHSKPEDLKNE